MDIKDLYRQGHSIRAIVTLTGRSRNTVRSVLRASVPQGFSKTGHASRLDPFKPYLKQRYEECALSSVRLRAEIAAQGFTGSVDIVQRYVKTLRTETVNRAKATVRFETAPGQQAQADWAEVGTLPGGQKVYAFLMVLGFSRMLFVAFTTSMALPALLHCHQEAFGFFGGIPGSVLYDNMAQVRLPGTGELHPLMADFAAHFGFAVKTHRVRRPRTKGKVERMVDYLKDNFLNGRTFAGVEDLLAQGSGWLTEANQRLHATTGERPIDLLPRENLSPLSLLAAPYVLAARHDRRVDAESFVQFDRSRYSVPPQYVGKRVLLVQKERRIELRMGDLVIAEHNIATAPGSCVVHKEHIEALWRETIAAPAEARTPVPKVDFTDAHTVASCALCVYEELATEGVSRPTRATEDPGHE